MATKSREPLITLQTVCAKLKFVPKDVRVALRKAKVAKAEGRYAWKTESEAMKAIKAAMVDDPEVDERKAGKTLQKIAKAGLDVKTGKQVGKAKATESARQHAEMANS